jgi:hypothetical protein
MNGCRANWFMQRELKRKWSRSSNAMRVFMVFIRCLAKGRWYNRKWVLCRVYLLGHRVEAVVLGVKMLLEAEVD